MRVRVLLSTFLASMVCAGLAVGWTLWRAQEADARLAEAEALLFADFDEAPDLARIRAEAARDVLDDAAAAGASGPTLRGLRAYADAVRDLQQGDFVMAEGAMTIARRQLGDRPDLAWADALVARGRSRHDEAAEHLSALRGSAPEDPRGALLAVDIALDRGERAAARVAVEDLRRIASRVGIVHDRLGLVRELEGDLEGAADAYRRAVDADPSLVTAWVNLGRLERQARNPQAASVAFGEALRRDPENPDALLGRGLTRAALGDLAAAERDFVQAAALAPNDAEPLLALGDLRRDVGAYADAVATYREAIARDGADAASWLKLGNALALVEDYGLAGMAFEEALRRAPNLAAAHNGLGASRMHTGDPTGAQAAFERAASLDPLDPNPWMNLGLLHERTGATAAAAGAWREALDRDPTSDIARRRLDRLGSPS